MNNTLNVLLRFSTYLKPYRKKVFIAFLFMLLSILLQLPMPFLTKYLIDNIIVKKNLTTLNIIGLVLLGVLIFRAGFEFLEAYLVAIFRGRVLFDIRLKLYDHIQRLSLSYFHKKETGYLMSRISGDVDAVQGLLADTIITFLENILIFIVGIICVFYLHYKLALICLSILPIYLLSLQIFNKRIRGMSHTVREKYALVQKDLQELLSAITLIKAFTGERRSTIRLLKSLKEAIRNDVKLDITATLASISSVVISSVGPLIVIWYGSSEVIHGQFTIGGLMAFSSFVRYLFGPTKILFNINISVQRSLAASERIFQIMDTPPEKKGLKDFKIKNGKIVYDNVSFSYNGEQKILDNINFEAQPGKIYALVGRSGVGKTSFVSLLLKFYEPNEGTIYIDDENINEVKVESLRKGISYVTQDTFLFSDTIKENLKFGNPKVDDTTLFKIARYTFIDQYIKELKDGYETKVGERGINLSGGERQRIAIARALMKDPKILILDEATSQIDSNAENLIQKGLKKLLNNCTTFIISHRLSTIQNADRIIVLDNGNIVCQGTHNDLIDNCTIYKNLYHEQFIKKEDE